VHDRLLTLSQQLADAPLAPELWPQLLGEVADLTGGWGGHFVAAEGGVWRAFLCDERIGGDLIDEFGRLGGADPARNPRAALCYAAAPMTVLNDAHLAPTLRDRNPLYRQLYARVDAAYTVIGLLLGSGPARVIFSANFTRRHGAPDAAAHALLETLLPSFAAAARVQLRLDGEVGRIALGALDAVSAPTILCDAWGRICDVSPSGEALMQSGALLAQRRGYLTSVDSLGEQSLADAIIRAGIWRPGLTPPSSVVVLRDADGAPARLDVCPLPRSAGALGLGGVVLVIGPRRRSIDRDLLRALGLTPAEIEVALGMLAGRSSDMLAAERAVSRETIRTQQKSLYAKLNVSGRAELIARLAGLN
jgi:DNA-binding CsgD family transcriptional regulator